jgi:SAM-dependent methyltransferase
MACGYNGVLRLISEYCSRPEFFAQSTAAFWDDPHISKQMLSSHLDPDSDGASRKHTAIDKEVRWILEASGLHDGDSVLDLGCGPGLYCVRFYQNDLSATGMDYSRRSIQYAKRYAENNGLDIEYVLQNYLTIEYNARFHLITLINYDFGVLPDEDRDKLVRRIYRALRPDGYFVFDVFTPHHHDETCESRTWSYKETGFWRATPHLVLEEVFKYPQHSVLLHQCTVFDGKRDVAAYRIWDHAYTRESIGEVLLQNGFSDMRFYADLTGREYAENSKRLAIMVRK